MTARSTKLTVSKTNSSSRRYLPEARRSSVATCNPLSLAHQRRRDSWVSCTSKTVSSSSLPMTTSGRRYTSLTRSETRRTATSLGLLTTKIYLSVGPITSRLPLRAFLTGQCLFQHAANKCTEQPPTLLPAASTLASGAIAAPTPAAATASVSRGGRTNPKAPAGANTSARYARSNLLNNRVDVYVVLPKKVKITYEEILIYLPHLLLRPAVVVRLLKNGATIDDILAGEERGVAYPLTAKDRKNWYDRIKKQVNDGTKLLYNLTSTKDFSVQAMGPENDMTADAWFTRDQVRAMQNKDQKAFANATSQLKHFSLREIYGDVDPSCVPTGNDAGIFTAMLEYARQQNIDYTTRDWESLKAKVTPTTALPSEGEFANLDMEALSRLRNYQKTDAEN